MATRTRKGNITESRGRRGPYYKAAICVNYRHMSKGSYDRAVCEAWLAEMLEAHPVWETDSRAILDAARRAKASGVRMAEGITPAPCANPFRAAKPVVSETPTLWMVVAETNPMTAHYRIRVRQDWRRPERVLGYDLLSESPFSWIADDNGGEGYGSEEEARVAALAIERDPCVSLAVRPLARRWRNGGNGNDCKD